MQGKEVGSDQGVKGKIGFRWARARGGKNKHICVFIQLTQVDIISTPSIGVKNSDEQISEPGRGVGGWRGGEGGCVGGGVGGKGNTLPLRSANSDPFGSTLTI